MPSSLGYWCQAGIGQLKQTKIIPGEIEINAVYGGISPGTEKTVGRGETANVSERQMACRYMRGHFGDEIFYGYSVVGKTSTNDLVFTMHPHQQRFRVDSEHIYLLPEGVSAQRATLAPNLETAINAIWDANAHCGEHFLVVGGGIVGSLTAMVLSGIPGTTVHLVDNDIKKIEKLKSLNWGVNLHSCVPKYKFHKIFHTSSSASGLQSCIEASTLNGTVIDMSWYGEKSLDLQLGHHFHYNRVQIKASQVSNISPNVNMNYSERMQAVFKILEDPVYDQFISERVRFSDLPQFMRRLYKNEVQPLSVLIEY